MNKCTECKYHKEWHFRTRGMVQYCQYQVIVFGGSSVYCYDERMSGSCGIEGNHWEPREVIEADVTDVKGEENGSE